MAQNPVRVVARIVAKPDKVEETRALLVSLIAPTRKEPGCVSYQLLQNRADATDFTFVEEWESEAALNAHFTTDHVKAAFAKAPELVAAAPDIRQYAVVQ
jgi:quinol monooxygenase YgiN